MIKTLGRFVLYILLLPFILILGMFACAIDMFNTIVIDKEIDDYEE